MSGQESSEDDYHSAEEREKEDNDDLSRRFHEEARLSDGEKDSSVDPPVGGDVEETLRLTEEEIQVLLAFSYRLVLPCVCVCLVGAEAGDWKVKS